VARASQGNAAHGLQVGENTRRAPSEPRTLSASEDGAELSGSPRLAQPPRRTRSATGTEAAAGSSIPATSGLPRPEVDVLQSVRERNAQSVSRRDQSNLQEEERAWMESL